MVLPSFVRQALAGHDLTVYGDGSQTRCFAHVHDTVDAILRLLDSEDAVGRVFNVGSRDEISILDLARLVIERSASDAGIRLVPYHEAYDRGLRGARPAQAGHLGPARAHRLEPHPLDRRRDRRRDRLRAWIRHCPSRHERLCQRQRSPRLDRELKLAR